ncbi:MAG: hypothetical protein AAFZ15_05105 [Bacteroidota bacterium]
MKTILKLMTPMMLWALLFTSCEKKDQDNQLNEEQTQQMIISTEDHATADDLFQDIEDRVDEAIETRGADNDCPVVWASPDWQTFPRTVTIDFGDECVGPDGRTRQGKIIVEVTDNILNPQASRTATLDNFFIDDVKIEGSRTWTNQGYDADGNITLLRTVRNGKIIYPNGEEAEWDSEVLLTQTAGGNTPLNFFDNVFEMTGTAAGINRNGRAYEVFIESPLVLDKICPWLVSGIFTLTVDNVDVSVNYGTGNCDNKAMLTLPNGTQQEIVIGRWW